MVNNNKIPIEVKKPFETVCEVKNETPSYEEFVKTYENDGNLNYADLSGGDIGEAKGYGPCKKDGCSCSCNGEDFSCSCRWDIIKGQFHKEHEYHYGYFKTSGEGKVGLLNDSGELSPNVRLGLEDSISAIRKEESGGGESSYFTVSRGVEVSLDKDGIGGKFKAGFDLVGYKDEDVQIRLGVNADTGGSITDDGIEGKFLGFGASIGKQTGISTPLGEVKFKTEDCVIQ